MFLLLTLQSKTLDQIDMSASGKQAAEPVNDFIYSNVNIYTHN